MGTEIHPAWNEVIIPFLDHQCSVDQLWCASKQLHRSILQRISSLTCYICPTDSPLKKRGIYPSYLAHMTGLRDLKVMIHPRLIRIHQANNVCEIRSQQRLSQGNNYVPLLRKSSYSCHYTELLCDDLPLSLKRFDLLVGLEDIDFMDIDAGMMIEPTHKLIFDWLDRFQEIRIGENLMSSLVHTLNIIRVHCRGMNLEAIKHQYITSINVEELCRLLYLLKDNHKLTDLLLDGITHIALPSSELAMTNDNITCIEAILLRRYGEQQDKIFNCYKLLYQLLPNLTSILGCTPFLPSGCHTYNYISKSNAMLPTLVSAPLRCLRASSLAMFLSPNIRFPPTLTSISIYDEGQGLVAFSMSLDDDPLLQLLLSLPKTLLKLDLWWNGQRKVTWNRERIRALPRSLVEFNCANFHSEYIEELPPGLTYLNSGNFETLKISQLLRLPRTFKMVNITVSDIEDIRFPQCISHFTQLTKIVLSMVGWSNRNFPKIVFPESLESAVIRWPQPFLYDFDTLEKECAIPLTAITWPSKMKHLNLDARRSPVTLWVDNWNLPQYLEELIISNIFVGSLANSLPRGLNSFQYNIKGYMQSKIDKLTAEHWPTCTDDLALFPHPSLCIVQVSIISNSQYPNDLQDLSYSSNIYLRSRTMINGKYQLVYQS